MNKKVAKAIYDAQCYILGPITPSVKTTVLPVYPELRRLYSNPDSLELVASELAKLIKKERPDYLVGGATAGIPLACAVSLKMRLPFLYVFKEPKDHGSGGAVFGAYEKNKTAVLVDDLIAYGKAKKKFVDNLEKEGIKVKAIAVILDIPRESRQDFQQKGINIYSLVGQKEMIEFYQAQGAWPKELVDLLLDFEKHVFEW